MSSPILNAIDLKKGKKSKLNPYIATFWQPLQMLSEKDKDDDWRKRNLDFLEWQGMKMILRNKSKFMSNYKVANGEIERAEYIRENMSQEALKLADQVNYQELAATQLKYYSLTDKVVDILCNEFAERTSLLTFDLRDPISFNEMADKKKEEMGEYLLQQAALKQMIRMIQMGISEDSEEGQQMLSQDTLKGLPQIQKFYDQDWKSVYQDWAWHCMQEDVSRFNMQELEVINFRHSLITDREYWHFRMLENDYEIEIWNPMLVAYQKSPHCKYMSGAAWIVHSTEMTVPDVIDMYGWQMSSEQMQNLNRVYTMGGTLYSLPMRNDGSYYDSSQSREWNQEGPGLAMRQYLTAKGITGSFNENVVRDILFAGEDLTDYGDINLCRVSTVYWTTQRKMYHLTKVNEEGELVQDIVTEDYKVTEKPVYNDVIYKEKTARSLVFGEHLEEIWVNEKWGGIKIGPNIPSWAGMQTSTGLQPMYIGYNNGKPGRLPYQFKGDKSIIGSKLPVEGCVYTDLVGNTKSRSLVDKMKPWQIPYNIVNNMITDVTIDEIGIFAAFNPNIFPKESLGDDWQTNNFSKIVDSMRAGYLPTKRSVDNMENGVDPKDIERVDLTQYQRFSSLIQRAQYFKAGALEAVGITPQRAGTPMSHEQTAEEVKSGIAASYAQTEHYFSQHSDMLMPRVHQMRTDLAQYCNSTNPSIRIQYTTDSNARAWMEINGTELLGRDFGVKCKSKSNSRGLLKKIQQYLLTNNTLADHMPDQIKAMKAETMVELDTLMAAIDKRREQEEQQRMEMEKQQYDQSIQIQRELLEDKQAFEAEQKELDRQKDIYVAEIKAMSTAALAKPSEEGEKSYQQGLDRLEQQQQFRETMNLDREKHITNTRLEQQKIQMRQEEVEAENKRTQQQLQQQKIQAKLKAKEKKKK